MWAAPRGAEEELRSVVEKEEEEEEESRSVAAVVEKHNKVTTEAAEVAASMEKLRRQIAILEEEKAREDILDEIGEGLWLMAFARGNTPLSGKERGYLTAIYDLATKGVFNAHRGYAILPPKPSPSPSSD